MFGNASVVRVNMYVHVHEPHNATSNGNNQDFYIYKGYDKRTSNNTYTHDMHTCIQKQTGGDNR